jgi:short-subunit dehydrogenase
MTTSTSRPSLGTAVVTGASAGLGRVFADRLARRGHDLLLIARRGDRLEAAATELRAAHGVDVRVLVADLGKPSDLDKVVTALAADARITMLVNNAGVGTMAPIAATTPAQAAAMIDVNIGALTALTLAVLPGFKARDHGTIVNIGSVLGFASLPVSSIYSGTKSYVMFLTRGLQDELAGTNVRVQLVAPAATATEIWDLAGVPLSSLNAETVMRAEDCVDAALAGLDAGERVTLPSVEDASALSAFDGARMTLLGAAQRKTPASRYAVAAQ